MILFGRDVGKGGENRCTQATEELALPCWFRLGVTGANGGGIIVSVFDGELGALLHGMVAALGLR